MQISHTKKNSEVSLDKLFQVYVETCIVLDSSHVKVPYRTNLRLWGLPRSCQECQNLKKMKKKKKPKGDFQCRRESWRTIFKGMGETQSVSHVRVPYIKNKRHWGSQRSRPDQPNFLTDIFVQTNGPKMPKKTCKMLKNFVKLCQYHKKCFFSSCFWFKSKKIAQILKKSGTSIRAKTGQNDLKGEFYTRLVLTLFS